MLIPRLGSVIFLKAFRGIGLSTLFNKICDPIHQESEGYKSQESFRLSEHFEYVVNAATSAATKLHQPSVTYLNKGQLYELRMRNLTEPASNRFVKCQIKIGFQVLFCSIAHTNTGWVRSTC